MKMIDYSFSIKLITKLKSSGMDKDTIVHILTDLVCELEIQQQFSENKADLNELKLAILNYDNNNEEQN